MRLMSGSGPFGPIFTGVWQSWHADVLTRYLPRSTGETTGAAVAGGAGAGCEQAAIAITSTAAAAGRMKDIRDILLAGVIIARRVGSHARSRLEIGYRGGVGGHS